MTRFNHNMGVDDEQWEWMQAMSGLMNPAAYGREIIAQAKREHEIKMAINGGDIAKAYGVPPEMIAPKPPKKAGNGNPRSEPVSPRRAEFDARWEELDCDDCLDEGLMTARNSFIREQGIRCPDASQDEREEMALRYIERAVTRGSMTNPRGWLCRRYQDLQKKPPRRTYAR